MSYERISDILSIVSDATRKGHLKWTAQPGGKNRDFVTRIGEHKLEIELDISSEARPVKVYLWDMNSNILDYVRVEIDNENYYPLLRSFEVVQKSVADVPSILSEIVNTLQALD